MNNIHNFLRTRKASFGGTLVAIFMLFGISQTTFAQVITNGGSGLAPTYTSLDLAIQALNAATITSPVVITLTANQTAPIGGYNITAEGTATNTIIIQGGPATSTITANPALVAGTLTDAIFKLVGADFVTIRGLTMQENATNIVTAAPTNTMTEWGVALLYATTTNGAQNNTIQNNAISLNRNYQNTFAVYSNSTHSATVISPAASATTTAGNNSGLTVQGNTISNVNNGIVVVGPLAAADHNNGLNILNNTITNYGTTSVFSPYANVSTSVSGIVVTHTINYNININTVTSSVGGVIVGPLRGIHVPSFFVAPIGTITNNVNSNIVSLQAGAINVALNGIAVEGSTGNVTTTLNVNSNDFTTFGHTVAAASGSVTFINVVVVALNVTIQANTFTNMSLSTTGTVLFIGHGYSIPAGGLLLIADNAIVTGFTRTSPGNILLTSSNASSGNGSTNNYINNNFSNITVTGASAITGFGNTDGGTGSTKTITGNTFNNWTGGTSAINTMNFTYWNGVSTLSNNTITNITGQGSIVGMTIGATSNVATSVTVGNNTINNLSSTGAGGNVTGITCSNSSTGVVISNNAINNLSSTGGASTVNGITIAGTNALGTTITRNKIHSLSGTGTGVTVNGINVTSGSLVIITNNIIGVLNASNATGLNSAVGINASATATYRIYFNSIFLNATSTSVTTFGTSVISFSATATALDLRNNILVNVSTPAQEGANVATNGISAVLRRSGGTAATIPANYAVTSNNNILWSNPTLGTNNHLTYVEGTATITNPMNTYALMKAFMVNRDQVSNGENPPFIFAAPGSPAFLHLNPAIATFAESNGSAIAGITVDFDGDTRNVTTPDVGADEYNGISIDLSPPTIVYTPLANTCSIGARTLTATITDITGVPTTGAGLPVLYWRINAAAYTPVTATFVSGNTYTFTFGAGSVANDVVSYYVVAQDLATTPNVGANLAGAAGFTTSPPAAATPPTTPSSYVNSATLTGTYTVGVTGAYPTLTAAVAAYNTACLTGAVVFSLIDATYPTETFPIVINSNSFASATNTLTIRPATSVTPLISGSSATAIIRLNGADFVTINGSNTATGTTRDWTIENINAGTSSAIIWNGSASLIDGATNNTFRNLNIRGNAPLTTFVGIFSGSGATIGSPADASNGNCTIQNNAISKAQIGLGIAGVAGGQLGDVVTQNSIGSAVATDYIGFTGMFFSSANGLQVTNNTISNIITSSTNPIGINVAGNVTNTTFNANTISGIAYTGTAGYGGKGININTGNAASNLTLSNNSIADIRGDGYSTLGVDAIVGIRILGNTGGIRLYYNSVNLGSGSFAGFTTIVASSAALYVSAGVVGLDVRNNIFAGNLVNTNNAGSKVYAIYSDAPNTAFTNINNNNYFVSGTQGFLGYLTSDRVLLADIVTGFGQNVASVNTDPIFTSATNLLPTNALLDNKGVFIAGITTDIVNATRNASTPDVGAFEFGASCPTITFTNTTVVSPNATVGTAYSLNAGATASSGTITYSSTTLPAGFSINTATGAITSVPASMVATPSATYVVTAQTSVGCTATQSYTFAVNAAVAACPILIAVSPATGILAAQAAVGSLFTQTFGATSTPAGTTYTYTTNAPAPFAINPTTGVFSGTPTATNVGLAFTVTATPTSPSGCIATATSYTLVINPPCTPATTPTLTLAPAVASAGTLVRGTVGVPYSQQFTGTGVTGTYTYTLSLPIGFLPAGLTFNTATGLLSGTPNVSTSVTFRVIANVNGCASAPVIYSLVINPSPTTSVDTSLANLVKVSPNPSSSNFNVDFGSINMTKSSVRVYDAQGKVVFTSENNTNLMTIPLEKFANGIYLMEVETSKGRILKRLAKQ